MGILWSLRSNTTFAQWARHWKLSIIAAATEQSHCRGGHRQKMLRCQYLEAQICYCLPIRNCCKAISCFLQDPRDYQGVLPFFGYPWGSFSIRPSFPPALAAVFLQRAVAAVACQLWEQAGKARSLKGNCFPSLLPYTNTLNGDLSRHLCAETLPLFGLGKLSCKWKTTFSTKCWMLLCSGPLTNTIQSWVKPSTVGFFLTWARCPSSSFTWTAH